MLEYAPDRQVAVRPLGTLCKGESGVVAALVDTGSAYWRSGELTDRLLEMGFIEGTPVEILHEGPIGRDPVGIRLHNSVIALRRSEANAILVTD